MTNYKLKLMNFKIKLFLKLKFKYDFLNLFNVISFFFFNVISFKIKYTES